MVYQIMQVHVHMTRKEFDTFYFAEGKHCSNWNKFFKSVYQFAIEKRDADVKFICENMPQFKKKKELSVLEYNVHVRKRAYDRILDQYDQKKTDYEADRSDSKKAALKEAESNKKEAYSEYKAAKATYDTARSNLSDAVFYFTKTSQIVKAGEFNDPSKAMRYLLSKATIMCHTITRHHLGQMISDHNSREHYVSDTFMLEDSMLPATAECRVNNQTNKAEVMIRAIVRVDGEENKEPLYDMNPDVIKRLTGNDNKDA